MAKRGIVAFTLIALAFSAISGKRPDYLGVKNGQLTPCPDSPNCVSTQSVGGYGQAKPIKYDGDTAAARARIMAIIQATARTRIVTATDYYIYAEFRSRIFRLVDDVEFFFDDARREIHFRAASRIGYHDMNANLKRMDAIRTAFEAAN